MSVKAQRAGIECERALRQLKRRLFTDDVKLTLVARHPSDSEAHVIVSAEPDNLLAVADVLTVEAHRNAPHVCPGCYAVAPERCSRDCIDAALESDRERRLENHRLYGVDTEDDEQ